VRVLVIHPRDPAAPTVGGIQTFLHDFVKYAPSDFEITIAGTTTDRSRRPIGRKSTVRIGDRDVTTLPLAPATGVPRDPLGLIGAFLGQARLRLAMLGGGRVLQVHRPYRAFSSSALESMARVFVVNEPGVDIVRREHPRIADRVAFLPVWYDPETFFPASVEERQRVRGVLRADLGLDASDDLPLILFAGRLDPIKDPELAIDGLAELHRRGRPARLVVAGSGQLRPALLEQARRQQVEAFVHFVGDVPRTRLAEIMRVANVLLLTSRAEGGGPRVVVEALASGMPAVATAVGEVRRTVAHRVNGWLIEERTADAVADGLKWVLEQEPAILREQAITAVRPYAAAVVLERVYGTYRDLVASAAR
jgi:glycosyltransferase involved in cell wall biosynthesis